MRILISARRFGPPFMGGADVYAERLGRALQRLGHTVSYIGFNTTQDGADSGIEVVQDAYAGSPVWRLQFAVNRRPAETFALAYDAEVGQVVERILDHERPDLFLILNFYLLTFAAVEVARRRAIPVAHIATDFIPVCRRATLIQWDGQSCRTGESIRACARCFVSQRRLGRAAVVAAELLPDQVLARQRPRESGVHPLKLLNPYWRQVDLMRRRLEKLRDLRPYLQTVLAPTPFTAEAFVQNGFTWEQVKIAPFGVEPDHPLARVTHSASDHVRFLFVGRIEPYKGAHLLVEAFSKLVEPRGATLTIYGGAHGYEDYFAQLQRQASANPRIRFAGTVPPEELGRAFGAADLFVLPSTWHENSPLIVLDALQSKTPVIASDIGGVQGLVKSGVNGWLFPMGDSTALQQVMQRAIDSPEEIEKLRRQIQLPTIDDYARDLVACFQQPDAAYATGGPEKEVTH